MSALCERKPATSSLSKPACQTQPVRPALSPPVKTPVQRALRAASAIELASRSAMANALLMRARTDQLDLVRYYESSGPSTCFPI